MAQKYPIGIQTFERIRLEGYDYADKTDLVYKLAHGAIFNFLSRPRRFGKSLLVSTLEAYFKGQKELFKGLFMEKLEKEWLSYPVLHLDLSGAAYIRPEALENLLNESLVLWEREYGLSETGKDLETRFKAVIKRANEKTGQKVVILIDEYEKPILDTIGNESLQNIYRSMLHGFYGCLKSSESLIKFALLTGVTKIGKLSVFSALNNLFDITFDARYSTICGICEEEIRPLFAEGLKEMAEANNTTVDDICAKLKERYDGYHFKKNSPDVYNPFSLLTALYRKEISDYWFATGTPTYLVELFKANHYQIGKIDAKLYSEEELSEINSFDSDVIPLLYQSGYLTLKEYDAEFKSYKLGFPNKEVEKGLLNFFVPFYSRARGASEFDVPNFIEDIRKGDATSFMERIAALMADTPYEIESDLEVHVQNFCYLLFKLLGYYVEAEYRTNIGRIDLIFKTKGYIYIMEFKNGRSAKEALKQIKARGYDAPFKSDPRKKFLIGANFSLKARGLGKFIIEEG